jgi:hypothetical protein
MPEGVRDGAWQHARISRRAAVQAGAIGLLGLGMNHLAALREAPADGDTSRTPKQRTCIFIFLSGGLAQHDSFDMKPDAPDTVRGEFRPVATDTPGLSICEHLPMLARRSRLWALCRSLTHPSNEHSQGHHIMLTGRTALPLGFRPDRPGAADWPSIAAIAGAMRRQDQDGQPGAPARNNLPPAVVLPERLVHNSGRVIPGQFAGVMGSHRDPWFVEASPFHPRSYGAFPEYAFDHQQRGAADERLFQAPQLALPHGLTRGTFTRRTELLGELERQRRFLDAHAEVQAFDRHREKAVSLLTEDGVRRAFDVTQADERTQERYGRNSFGWSLLMARRLVEAGVSLVQVNLGSNETWDTHGNAFPHLREKLLPPMDRAVSAILDDLDESGQLGDTLVVMAGEFGRTPKISHLPKHYELPGRDHWGAAQTLLLAGGGVRGGTVVGATDRQGAYPAEAPQTPENFAATIYQSLGIPATAVWHDALDRPHHVYHGEPIPGLSESA